MNKSLRKRNSPKGSARREQILDVATRLFARGGFNTVALSDIAEEVGITQAGLLHHFPSKKALFMGMLERRDQMYIESRAQGKASGLGFFEAFFATLKGNEADPDVVRLFTILSSEALVDDHPAKDWFARRYDRIISDAIRDIDLLVDPEKLPPGVEVEDIARGIIALADGLRLQWLMDPDSLDRTTILRKFTAMLHPYMRRPEED